MKKLIKISNRDIDGRTPTMSISHDMYLKGPEKLREQAKAEKKRLITNNGIEDYSEKGN